MLCEACGEKPAIIHTTDIVNNVKSEKHVCEECFKGQDLQLPFGSESLSGIMSFKPVSDKNFEAINDLLGQFKTHKNSSAECPDCGMTLEELEKKGAIGCAKDYEVFAEYMDDLLNRLHGESHHTGKLPQALIERRAREHQVRQLEADLGKAVDEENFEEAARLRDRILALENGDRTAESSSTKNHD